ncbi:MAG: tetratricopeptide repeat protein [Ignavibacteriales bacterium]|nr:Beta-barrel assembly-enhancing protease [Ignavibacteriaceae bacterium]MBW7873281.1 tetratricopeptide repeat protein [Ignavibacteria bacterium]MBZ0196566.1 tetratricopeptide repeat protein [Ignavibacteriaceae bacterium]MCZ2143019.1 tetratricopeptide repeat protein [Ignavibacteriales bacterium]WKZ71838.1 MAG: tetratricopeptide repeat protein [Ignavibacteriaceae bacterium]
MKNDKSFELAHRLKRAEEFNGGGKTLHAIQMYQAIINDFTDDPTAWYKLIDIYDKMGRRDSAITLLEEMNEAFTNENEVRLFTGHFYFKHQMWEDSLRTLKGFDMSFDNIALFICGIAFFNIGEYAEAAENLRKFIDNEPDSAFIGEAHLYIGRSRLALGELNLAVSYLTRGAVLMPTNPDIYQYLAVYYYKVKMYAHAAENIETALKMGADSKEAFELALEIFLAAGAEAKAEKLCRSYIAEREPSSKIYTGLAQILLKKNLYKESEGYLQTAIKLDPLNLGAQKLLKELTERRDNDLVKNL